MNRANPMITVQETGDRLSLRLGDRHLTNYIFRGTWKPYFFPLNGPSGNVVRGIKGSEHPNQHGLTIGYGGPDDGGSTDIWSDWDEPPLGPCGKMLHEEFLRIEQHPSQARIVESLVYVRPDGTSMAHETRDMRVHALPEGELRIDFVVRIDRLRDEGNRPLVLAARVADSMRVFDLAAHAALENPGKIQNAEGGVNEEGTRGQPSRWCDFSGPCGDGWSGIALMDHPRNPGHPGLFATRDYGLLILKHEFPSDRSELSLLCVEWSAYIHRGNAEEGRVEEMYQKWVAG